MSAEGVSDGVSGNASIAVAIQQQTRPVDDFGEGGSDARETDPKDVGGEEAPANKTNKDTKQPLSKNQQKKLKKWERRMEIKQRRKQQEKDARAAKAKAQGRDLDRERKEVEERTASGEGRRRRKARFDAKMKQADSSFQVCLDCSFESQMTEKEINSLALQLRYCYATNKRSRVPCHLAAASVDGETRKHLQNVMGFEEWRGYGYTVTSESLDVHFKSKRSSLVYLTSDSENVVGELEQDKVYVIGGIVDRNRLKRAAINRAESLGIATAKLPLDEHLKEMESTRVLTCNHVFDILLKYKECKDWKQALVEVLPERKGAKFVPDSKVEVREGHGEGEQAAGKTATKESTNQS